MGLRWFHGENVEKRDDKGFRAGGLVLRGHHAHVCAVLPNRMAAALLTKGDQRLILWGASEC